MRPAEAARPPEWYLGQAQVHATLALAAATASDSDNREWLDVAGGRFGGACSALGRQGPKSCPTRRRYRVLLPVMTIIRYAAGRLHKVVGKAGQIRVLWRIAQVCLLIRSVLQGCGVARHLRWCFRNVPGTVRA